MACRSFLNYFGERESEVEVTSAVICLWHWTAGLRQPRPPKTLRRRRIGESMGAITISMPPRNFIAIIVGVCVLSAAVGAGIALLAKTGPPGARGAQGPRGPQGQRGENGLGAHFSSEEVEEARRGVEEALSEVQEARSEAEESKSEAEEARKEAEGACRATGHVHC